MTTPPTEPYKGNTSPREAAEWIAAASSLVVTTHFKPDGDAVGSTLALARAFAMSSPGSACEIWYSGGLPDWTAEVAGETAFRHLDTHPAGADEPAQRCAIVDTGARSQLEALRGYLPGRAESVLIVDHHLNGDADLAARRLIDPSAAAAAQLVAGICARLLGVEPSALPESIATPLYLGLATDTGWFRYSNVSPATMRLAGDLLDAGARHNELFRIVEQRDKPGRLRLFARALTSLELHDNDRVALMTLTEADFTQSRARPGDTGGFADRVLVVDSVRVAAVLNETRGQDGATVTKVSLRSKDGPGAVDVNAVASGLGGGGHARAAGARFQGALAEAREAVLARLLPEGGG